MHSNSYTMGQKTHVISTYLFHKKIAYSLWTWPEGFQREFKIQNWEHKSTFKFPQLLIVLFRFIVFSLITYFL